MNFDHALDLINSFWADEKIPFEGAEHTEVQRVQKEFGLPLPVQLRSYLAEFSPESSFEFSNIGNPVTLYESKAVLHRAPGYNFNPITSDAIEGWSKGWVLIADEGADPIIVDLEKNNVDEACPVFKAMHGEGAWNFFKIANSLPEFLVLLAARHHALEGFPGDPIVDDENGFCLAPAPSAWYFPFMKNHLPRQYGDWAEDFDNA